MRARVCGGGGGRPPRHRPTRCVARPTASQPIAGVRDAPVVGLHGQMSSSPQSPTLNDSTCTGGNVSAKHGADAAHARVKHSARGGATRLEQRGIPKLLVAGRELARWHAPKRAVFPKVLKQIVPEAHVRSPTFHILAANTQQCNVRCGAGEGWTGGAKGEGSRTNSRTQTLTSAESRQQTTQQACGPAAAF